MRAGFLCTAAQTPVLLVHHGARAAEGIPAGSTGGLGGCALVRDGHSIAVYISSGGTKAEEARFSCEGQ